MFDATFNSPYSLQISENIKNYNLIDRKNNSEQLINK